MIAGVLMLAAAWLIAVCLLTAGFWLTGLAVPEAAADALALAVGVTVSGVCVAAIAWLLVEGTGRLL